MQEIILPLKKVTLAFLRLEYTTAMSEKSQRKEKLNAKNKIMAIQRLENTRWNDYDANKDVSIDNLLPYPTKSKNNLWIKNLQKENIELKNGVAISRYKRNS